MKTRFKNLMDRRAFTLIELMIVILIIGILMSGVFMLMGVAAKHGDTAKTRSKIQRLQNAISGFYAAYGTYPPVAIHRNPDPLKTSVKDDFDDQVKDELYLRALWASRAQPLAFEYPPPLEEDGMLNNYFQSVARTPNEVYGNASSINQHDWREVKIFKFGLMSYLLPRVAMVGIPHTGGFNEKQPDPGFYKSGQWEHNNKKSRLGASGGDDLIKALRSQSDVESRAVAKWLPNLEGMCAQLDVTIMNVSLLDNKSYFYDKTMDGVSSSLGGHTPYRGPYDYNGQKTILKCATVKDAWNMDFYYYSAPPYQSYRVWSSGPDKKTWPPWIPLESLSGSDRKLAAEWIKDDIVGID